MHAYPLILFGIVLLFVSTAHVDSEAATTSEISDEVLNKMKASTQKYYRSRRQCRSGPCSYLNGTKFAVRCASHCSQLMVCENRTSNSIVYNELPGHCDEFCDNPGCHRLCRTILTSDQYVNDRSEYSRSEMSFNRHQQRFRIFLPKWRGFKDDLKTWSDMKIESPFVNCHKTCRKHKINENKRLCMGWCMAFRCKGKIEHPTLPI